MTPPVTLNEQKLINKIQRLIKKLDTQKKLSDRQLQQSIDYYEEILSLMPGHVYWLDKNNVYLGCNNIQAAHAELSSRHEIIGKTNNHMPWKDQASELDKVNIEVMESKIPASKIEYAKMDNENKIFLSHKVPLLNKKNESIGLLGISIDITELKKTEEQLKIAVDAAKAANQAKTQFIANMSHDIRTPLTGVVSLSRLLEQTLSDPVQKQYAHWLSESGDQLMNMLNGILDVVSADHMNEHDTHQEPFDLQHMLHSIVQLERPTIEMKGLNLLTHIDDRIPRVLISDPTKIHRILLNLLGNAIKFTTEGSIEIGVSLLTQTQDTVTLNCHITDTGIGIPFELQDKVFERFFRVTPSYKGIYSGHGLGLHIAQSYAHLLGSNILLSSEPNVGTTFYFELTLKIGDETSFPLHDDDASQYEHTIVNKDTTIKKNMDTHAPTVLLVEDNTIALKMLECFVSQMGLNFVSAVDGESALQLATERSFDLIITDLGLPALSGIEWTRKFRLFEIEHHRMNVPIIGVTAHADDAIKNECLDAGMNEILIKPMTASRLNKINDTYFPPKNNDPSSFITPSPKGTSLGVDLPNTEAELFALDAFPLLDVKSVLPGMNNNTNLLNNILKTMRESELPKDLLDIDRAYVAFDWEGVEKIAHRMKGGLVYCGTSRLAYACQYLERYRKAGHTRCLDALYKQLRHVADDTIETLNQWLET
jgi:two-component system, OmpR family, aerobic respiration control sensor histidine kinase ArcB